MTIRIIKPGSKNSVRVREFSFSEDTEEYREEPCEQPFWLQAPTAPANMIPKNEPPPPPEPPVPTLDLAQVEKNAYESGFRQGEKAGMEIAEKKVEAVMRRYAETVLDLGKTKPMIYAQVEREVVKLAMEVDKYIFHR